jgi:NAD(P)-dependent dehydrogenase (short-subunit alcohol dehydrogenase family)
VSQVLIVTGSGRGIGAATAIAAARQGYAVGVNYQSNSARADEVVRTIRDNGGSAVALQADIGDEAAVTAMFETVDREFGRIDALVNNAGILTPVGRVESVDADALAHLVQTNIVGTILCCREAIRRMSTSHGGAGGVIVNVGSVMARLGGGGTLVPYSATKAAVETLTFGLSQEVAGEGIRVTGVSPGLVETEMVPASRIEQVAPTLPMKRLGQVDEVAEAVVWLLSDKASYVAGTMLGVTGGR